MASLFYFSILLCLFLFVVFGKPLALCKTSYWTQESRSQIKLGFDLVGPLDILSVKKTKNKPNSNGLRDSKPKCFELHYGKMKSKSKDLYSLRSTG